MCKILNLTYFINHNDKSDKSVGKDCRQISVYGKFATRFTCHNEFVTTVTNYEVYARCEFNLLYQQ